MSRTVLLLHGLGGSAEDWKEAAAALPKGLAPVALDFPGFGKTPRPHDSYDPASLARWVLGELDDRDVETAVVAGHSLGGRVAGELSRDPAPERVSRDDRRLHVAVVQLAEDPARERRGIVAVVRADGLPEAGKIEGQRGQALRQRRRDRGPVLGRAAEAVEEEERPAHREAPWPAVAVTAAASGHPHVAGRESSAPGRSAGVAQLLWEQQVGGSNPPAPTTSSRVRSRPHMQ